MSINFGVKKTRVAVAVVLILAVAIGGWAVHRHHRYKHLAVHVPGAMYRSAWVDADVISELVERYQLRSVVNLCRPDEMGVQRRAEERATVLGAGAKFIEISMPLSLDVQDPAVMASLTTLADESNFPMLVHCQHGVTRTAKFLSIYDIRYRGMTAEQSLDAMPLFSRDAHDTPVWDFAERFERSCGSAIVGDSGSQARM